MTNTKVHGLIEIKATDHGDEISVTGAYADRLQRGVFVLSKLLANLVQQVADSGSVGHSSVPELRETIPKKSLALRFSETTDFADLEPPEENGR